jgi:NitT/TauT family transport system substrate-binding protein
MSLKFFSQITTVFVAVVTCFGSWSCSGSSLSGKTETIHIGVPPLEQNTLIYVAEQKGFFTNNGLRVTIRDYDTGVTAIQGLLDGKVSIAGAAEFPVVRAIFRKEEIRVIACYDKFENDYIVGRSDRGIGKIPDLKGKRIGVTLKTINEFYLGRFLELNGMNIRDVTLVDLAPAQYLKAFGGGEVDAVIAWQPHIHRLEKEVKRTVVWPAQSSQPVFGVLVCSNGWLAQHGDTVKRFLKSLRQAEDHLIRHSGDAKTIVQKRLGYEDSYVDHIWPQHQFSLSLDETLVVAMKDEAQWLLDGHLVNEKTMPDFVSYIHMDGLKAVKPEAVNIVR